MKKTVFTALRGAMDMRMTNCGCSNLRGTTGRFDFRRVGGIPNQTQVGDRGIDGRIYPVNAVPERRGKAKGEFEFTDVWYPIQVKQRDKTGSPDIRDFEGVMTTHERTKGFFISFDYSQDAMQEIDHFFRTTGKVIVPLTVREILEEQIARKLV